MITPKSVENKIKNINSEILNAQILLELKKKEKEKMEVLGAISAISFFLSKNKLSEVTFFFSEGDISRLEIKSSYTGNREKIYSFLDVSQNTGGIQPREGEDQMVQVAKWASSKKSISLIKAICNIDREGQDSITFTKSECYSILNSAE